MAFSAGAHTPPCTLAHVSVSWRLVGVPGRTAALERCVHSLSARKSIIDQLTRLWPVFRAHAHTHACSVTSTVQGEQSDWAVAGVAWVSRKLHLAKTSWTETRLMVFNADLITFEAFSRIWSFHCFWMLYIKWLSYWWNSAENNQL